MWKNQQLKKKVACGWLLVIFQKIKNFPTVVVTIIAIVEVHRITLTYCCCWLLCPSGTNVFVTEKKMKNMENCKENMLSKSINAILIYMYFHACY